MISRIGGVVWAPRTTLEAVVRTPRVAGVLLLTVAVTFVASAILLQSEIGQLALLDRWERTALAFGQDVGDAEYAALQEATRHSLAYAAVTTVLSGPVLAAALALVLLMAFPGEGSLSRYRQSLAVTAYAGVILAIRQLLAAPVSYAREALVSPTSLSTFFSMLDEASPLARLMGVLDVFVIWWVVVLAIGVSVLSGRPARPLALMFTGIYVALAVVLTGIMAALGGTA